MPVIKSAQDVLVALNGAQPRDAGVCPASGFRVHLEIEGQEQDEEVQEGYLYTGEAEQANRMVRTVADMLANASDFTLKSFAFDADGCLVLKFATEFWCSLGSFDVTLTVAPQAGPAWPGAQG